MSFQDDIQLEWLRAWREQSVHLPGPVQDLMGNMLASELRREYRHENPQDIDYEHLQSFYEGTSSEAYLARKRVQERPFPQLLEGVDPKIPEKVTLKDPATGKRQSFATNVTEETRAAVTHGLTEAQKVKTYGETQDLLLRSTVPGVSSAIERDLKANLGHDPSETISDYSTGVLNRLPLFRAGKGAFQNFALWAGFSSATTANRAEQTGDTVRLDNPALSTDVFQSDNYPQLMREHHMRTAYVTDVDTANERIVFPNLSVKGQLFGPNNAIADVVVTPKTGPPKGYQPLIMTGADIQKAQFLAQDIQQPLHEIDTRSGLAMGRRAHNFFTLLQQEMRSVNALGEEIRGPDVEYSGVDPEASWDTRIQKALNTFITARDPQGRIQSYSDTVVPTDYWVQKRGAVYHSMGTPATQSQHMPAHGNLPDINQQGMPGTRSPSTPVSWQHTVAQLENWKRVRAPEHEVIVNREEVLRRLANPDTSVARQPTQIAPGPFDGRGQAQLPATPVYEVPDQPPQLASAFTGTGLLRNIYTTEQRNQLIREGKLTPSQTVQVGLSGQDIHSLATGAEVPHVRRGPEQLWETITGNIRTTATQIVSNIANTPNYLAGEAIQTLSQELDWELQQRTELGMKLHGVPTPVTQEEFQQYRHLLNQDSPSSFLPGRLQQRLTPPAQGASYIAQWNHLFDIQERIPQSQQSNLPAQGASHIAQWNYLFDIQERVAANQPQGRQRLSPGQIEELKALAELDRITDTQPGKGPFWTPGDNTAISPQGAEHISREEASLKARGILHVSGTTVETQQRNAAEMIFGVGTTQKSLDVYQRRYPEARAQSQASWLAGERAIQQALPLPAYRGGNANAGAPFLMPPELQGTSQQGPVDYEAPPPQEGSYAATPSLGPRRLTPIPTPESAYTEEEAFITNTTGRGTAKGLSYIRDPRTEAYITAEQLIEKYQEPRSRAQNIYQVLEGSALHEHGHQVWKHLPQESQDAFRKLYGSTETNQRLSAPWGTRSNVREEFSQAYSTMSVYGVQGLEAADPRYAGFFRDHTRQVLGAEKKAPPVVYFQGDKTQAYTVDPLTATPRQKPTPSTPPPPEEPPIAAKQQQQVTYAGIDPNLGAPTVRDAERARDLIEKKYPYFVEKFLGTDKKYYNDSNTEFLDWKATLTPEERAEFEANWDDTIIAQKNTVPAGTSVWSAWKDTHGGYRGDPDEATYVPGQKTNQRGYDAFTVSDAEGTVQFAGTHAEATAYAKKSGDTTLLIKPVEGTPSPRREWTPAARLPRKHTSLGQRELTTVPTPSGLKTQEEAFPEGELHSGVAMAGGHNMSYIQGDFEPLEEVLAEAITENKTKGITAGYRKILTKTFEGTAHHETGHHIYNLLTNKARAEFAEVYKNISPENRIHEGGSVHEEFSAVYGLQATVGMDKLEKSHPEYARFLKTHEKAILASEGAAPPVVKFNEDGSVTAYTTGLPDSSPVRRQPQAKVLGHQSPLTGSSAPSWLPTAGPERLEWDAMTVAERHAMRDEIANSLALKTEGAEGAGTIPINKPISEVSSLQQKLTTRAAAEQGLKVTGFAEGTTVDETIGTATGTTIPATYARFERTGSASGTTAHDAGQYNSDEVNASIQNTRDARRQARQNLTTATARTAIASEGTEGMTGGQAMSSERLASFGNMIQTENAQLWSGKHARQNLGEPIITRQQQDAQVPQRQGQGWQNLYEEGGRAPAASQAPIESVSFNSLTNPQLQEATARGRAAWAQASGGSLPSDSKDMAATIQKRLNTAINAHVNDVASELEKGDTDKAVVQETKAAMRDAIKGYASGAQSRFESALIGTRSGDETVSRETLNRVKGGSYSYVGSAAELSSIASRNPAVQRFVDQVHGGSYEAAMRGQETVIHGEGGAGGGQTPYLIGGQGQGNRPAGPRRMGGGMFGSPLGRAMYGAYISKRMWTWMMSPMLQGATAYGVGQQQSAMLAPGEDLMTTDAGFATRQELAAEYSSKGQYQQLGGFMDTSYALSGDEGQWGRTKSGLMLGGYAMAGGIAAAQTGMMMTAMSGTGAATSGMAGAMAGIGAYAAPALLVGGALMAGTVAMEAYNTFQRPDTPLSWGGVWREGVSNLAVAWEQGKELPAEEWWKMGGSQDNDLIPFGFLDNQMSREEAIARMSPEMQDYINFRGESATMKGVNKLATNIAQVTGEPLAEVRKGLVTMQQKLGGTVLGNQALYNQIKGTARSAGMSFSQLGTEGMTYAGQLGNLQGTTGFYHAVQAYSSPELSVASRGQLQQRGQQVAQFGGMIAGYYTQPNEAYKFVDASGISTQGEAQAIQQLLASANQFGYNADDIAYRTEDTGIGPLEGPRNVSYAEYTKQLTDELGSPYRANLVARNTSALSSQGVPWLAASRGSKGIVTDMDLAASLSFQKTAETYGGGTPQGMLDLSKAALTQNAYQTQLISQMAGPMASALNPIDPTNAMLRMSGLGLSNYQMQLGARMGQNDLGAWSTYARQYNQPQFQFLDQFNMPILQHDTAGWLGMMTGQAAMGNQGAAAFFGGPANARLMSTASNMQQMQFGLQQQGVNISNAGLEALAGEGGSLYGYQQYIRKEQAGLQMAGIGVQMQQLALQRSAYWGADAGGTWNAPTPGSLWGLEDQMRELQHTSQMGDFRTARERMEMGQRYAIQREGIQSERMAAQESYSTWMMSADRTRASKQRGWARQDWDYQDIVNNMQFEWGLEDIDEAIRLSSGRERKTLLKQKDRMITSKGMTDDHTEDVRSRQEELWKMEDERFDQQENYQKTLMALDKQSFELSTKQRQESYELESENLDRQEKEYLKMKELQDKQLEKQREFQAESLALQEQALGIQAASAALQQESIAVEEALATSNKKQQESWAKLLEQNPEEVIKALEEMAGGITDITPEKVMKLENMNIAIKDVPQPTAEAMTETFQQITDINPGNLTAIRNMVGDINKLNTGKTSAINTFVTVLNGLNTAKASKLIALINAVNT